MTIAAQSVTWLGIEAGSWPAWASAAVTSVAVAFAAITYRQNSRDRRSAQARKVYAKESTGGSAARRTYEPGDVVPDLSDGAVAAWHQRGAIDVGAMLSQETWIAAARTVRIVVELHNESQWSWSSPPPVMNSKDLVEAYTFHALCAGKVTLAAVQQAMTSNWTTAVQRLGLPMIPAGYTG